MRLEDIRPGMLCIMQIDYDGSPKGTMVEIKSLSEDKIGQPVAICSLEGCPSMQDMMMMYPAELEPYDKSTSADGEEGFLLFEFGTGRAFFRQYDKSKKPWGIKDYYINHPDLKIKIMDNSAVFGKGNQGEDILDVNLREKARAMRAKSKKGKSK